MVHEQEQLIAVEEEQREQTITVLTEEEEQGICVEPELLDVSGIYPVYEGEVVVTPQASDQTLYTNGFRLNQNITINAIPSNYGLISWDGSTLTVS